MFQPHDLPPTDKAIQQACRSSDIKLLSAELQACEPYAAELPWEVAQLRRIRDDILGTVRQRLHSLVSETDPTVIEDALEVSREVLQVANECAALRSRLKLLVDDARTVLRNMTTHGTNMPELLTVYRKYKPFASYLQVMQSPRSCPSCTPAPDARRARTGRVATAGGPHGQRQP